jgi:outer membrane protein OmpA-like peptidoglycan-associated protein/tetratricopeptide (TPR) repeat protein
MNLNKLVCFALFASTCISSLFAQQRDVKALSSEKRHELAEKLIKQGGYYAAIDHMKELVDKHPEDQTYIFKLAEAYFHSRDYKSAELWYAKLKETEDNKKKKKNAQLTLATFHYAEALKYNAKYEQAREVFGIFAQGNYKDVKGENYKAWAKNEVLSCEFAMQNKDRLRYAEIVNLDSNINAAYSDFSPRMKDDTTLLYASIQEDSVISVRHGDKHFEHTKIFVSTMKDSTWQEPEEVERVNSIFEHSANGTYSPDGKRFYFTRCRPVAGKMKCQIYVSEVENDKLSKPKKLGGHANHPAHTCTQPYSAKIKTGKTDVEVLFFASDMKGTLGGMDIWYSVIDKDGQSAKPVNCGRSVNTPRDEVAPFYDGETSALYFSSNYHYGFGGYDIFRAIGTQNKYGKPENVMKPINSNLDDTYYTFSKKDKYSGFLVSNRPGGMALLSETCCDDIYSFKVKQPTILVLTVTDSATGKVIENPTLTLKSTRYAPIADSILFNTSEGVMDTLLAQSDPSLLENLQLTENPKSFYVLEPMNLTQILVENKELDNCKTLVRTNKEANVDSILARQGGVIKTGSPRYVVLNLVAGKRKVQLADQEKAKDTIHVASSLKEQFEKAAVVSGSLTADALKKDSSKTSNVVPVTDSKLVSMEFVLNLHFQYDKAEIVEWDQNKLDSLVTILKSNPKMKMEFSTHTDWIGSDEYNTKLSFKRAAFISNYIVSKGISQKRVKGTGLGETKHIAPNANADGSDNPEGRQQNRRTEIKLIQGV